MTPPLTRLTLLLSIAALSAPQGLFGATVTNTGDSGAGSLRDAIVNATSGETIGFDPTLDGATITLTSAQLSISGLEVTIDATSLASGLTISGGGSFRVFAITGSSDVTLRNLKITDGNVVDQNGGGIAIGSGNLEMYDCVVRNCFASFNGGGVNLAVGVTATLDRCQILANSTGSLGFGGGIYLGGASTTLIRNSMISGNSSPLGGGLALANTSPTLVNCTIQGNSGHGMRNDNGSDPVITNCILWGNSAPSGSTAAQQLGNFGGSSNPVVSYCLIQGASGSASFSDGNATTWGAGNLNGSLTENNPDFAAPLGAAGAPHSGGDLHLLSSSPALNVGNNAAPTGSLDLAEATRIQDDTVDLGAYEGGFAIFSALYPALDPAADDNDNGILNLQEYGMGFDPSASPDLAAMPSLSKDGSASLLTVNQRSNALDLTAFLQTSTALGDTWESLVEGVHYTVLTTTPVAAGRDEIVIHLLDPDPWRFYRQGFTTSP